MIWGDCDCCDNQNLPLTRCWAAGGTETFACEFCTGNTDEVLARVQEALNGDEHTTGQPE
jgi:hypothetical protein